MKRLLDINLKKIQYFLCIVEEGSLTKAASRLYVSQPMLSKCIKEMEEELDITLFYRDGRTLKLSEPGKYLYEQWKHSISIFSHQIQQAYHIQQEQKTQIHMGCEHIMVLGANELWMNQVEAFQQQHPDIPIDIMALGLHEVKEKLIQGQLDLIICSDFDAQGLEATHHIALLKKLPVYVYGRKNHPVLSQPHVTWKDMKTCSFYTISPQIATWPEELLCAYASSHGFSPHIVGYTDTQLSQVMKVKTSDALMLSLQLEPLLQDDKLCAVQMGEDMTSVVIAWRKDSPEYLHNFANTLLSMN